MKIVIVGGGKVGYYLAKTLLSHGHSPTLIETSKSECRFLAQDLDIPVFNGDGTSIDVLKQEFVAKCDTFISVTGNDENNLISCQLAKKMFNIPKTVAKVNNPKNANVMRKLGIDIVISSTDNIARLLEHEVDAASLKNLLSIHRGEASILEITLPKNYRLNGKKLSEIHLPNSGIIISINRHGEIIIPRGDTTLCSDDIIICMAKNDGVHDIKKALRLDG